MSRPPSPRLRRAGLAGSLLAAAVILGAASVNGQQPRDGRAPAAGTGSISGVVVVADAMSSPARRATVEVSGVAMLTDDDGRFSFSKLPAGTYGVLATKAGFLSASFGSKRAGGPGTGVEVLDGQNVTGVRITMFRGGVLAGTVLDEASRPVPGAEIRAFRDGIDENTGQKLPLPVSVGVAEATTDDHGQYRLYGLDPGAYIVSTSGAQTAGGVRMTTEADVRYARQLLAAPQGTPPDPAVRRPAPVSSTRYAGSAPMYYPSAESPGEAARVTLGVAEERVGVDIVRRRTPAASVWGSVAGSFATIRGGGKVQIIDTASPYSQSVSWGVSDGRFGFGGVPPGRYDVVAQSDSGGFRARLEASVAGSEVALTPILQPGSTVAGRLVFQTTTGQQADPAFVRVSATGVTRADLPFIASTVKPDGSFSWTNMPPGSYRLSVSIIGNLQPGWRVKSALRGGLDLFDGTLDVGGSDAGEIVITVTDARSAISGTLQAADGTPVSGYSILAFSADRAFWRPVSRRTQIVRPNTNGMFALRDLPAGDYLIVALAGVETGQWHSADFLAELAPFGVKVSLADGEKKTQNMRISSSGGARR